MGVVRGSARFDKKGFAVPEDVRKRGRGAGFSLVEALVALTLFGVGTILLMQLAPKASQYATHARSLSAANGLAQAKIEELRSLPRLHGDLAAGVHVDPENPISGHYVRRWEVFVDDPIAGMRRVEVRVRADQTARADSVAVLTTYF